MGVVSYKKEKERKEKANNEYELRIGVIALLEFLLAVLCDVVSILGKISMFDCIVGVLVFGIILYGLNGKWIDKFTNKKMLRKIISLGSTYSVIVFAMEKAMLPILQEPIDKIVVIIILLSFVVTTIWLVIHCIRSKECKWNVD
jgi:hypothetical protein